MTGIADLLGATWCCEPRALEAFLRAAQLHRGEAGGGQQPRAQPRPAGDVATVPVRGVLTRGSGNSWLSWFGIASTGYDEIRDGVRAALDDASVRRIVLDIDSPGGDAHGLAELFRDLRAANEVKPITAAISGQGASAAYYIAAAAGEIVAERDALVGSIGAYAVVQDSSKLAGELGITVHVIRSGAHKGMGVSGAPVTAEQLAMAQSVIDDLADGFVRAVAEGRGMSVESARALADGATWLAKRAKGLGLIDRVGTLADAIAGGAGGSDKMADTIAGARSENDEEKDKAEDEDEKDDEDEDEEKGKAEEDEDDEDDEDDQDKKAASLAQLESVFAGRPDFVLRCLRGGYSLARAKREALELDNATLKAEVQKLRATAQAGIDPRRLSSAATSRSSADATDFIGAARAYKVEHAGCSAASAFRAVAKARPDLYEKHVHEARIAAGARPVKAWGSSEPARRQ